MFERKDGNLTLIAPELSADGFHIVIGLAPGVDAPTARDPAGTRHLVLTAYAKDGAPLPVQAMLDGDDLRYFDQTKRAVLARGSRLQLPGNDAASKQRAGKAVRIERDLVKYRRECGALLQLPEDPAPQPVFFSAALKAARTAKQTKAQAKDWPAILKNSGIVRQAEFDATGFNEWIAANEGKSLTRDEVVTFLEISSSVIEETVESTGEIDEDALQELVDELYNDAHDDEVQHWKQKNAVSSERRVYKDEDGAWRVDWDDERIRRLRPFRFLQTPI